MSSSVWLAFVMMISCTVAGNLLLKLGAVDGARATTVFGAINPKLVLGITMFGLAMLLYAWILRVLPLNIAQSLAAAQFISVILASRLVLSEVISPLRWFGIALIISGILVVAVSVEKGLAE